MRLLIFDIDGTLLLNGPITKRLFGESFAEVVGHPPRIEEVRFHGNTDRGIFRLLVGDDHDAYERHFDGFAASFTAKMREHYPSAEGPYLLPGARALVEALHARPDAALAIGTGNIRETAYVKLGRFELDSFFPAGGFGGDHLVRSDMILGAIANARAHYDVDFDPAESWVIGDTINDVVAARDAGCKVMGVMTGPHGRTDLAAADVVVDDLTQAESIAARLFD